MPIIHSQSRLVLGLRSLHDLYVDGGLTVSEFRECKEAAIAAAEQQYELLPISNLESPLTDLKILSSDGVIDNQEWALARHYLLLHARLSTDVAQTLLILRDYGKDGLISLYDYDTTKRHLLGEGVFLPTLDFDENMLPGISAERVVDFLIDVINIPFIPGHNRIARWMVHNPRSTSFEYEEVTEQGSRYGQWRDLITPGLFLSGMGFSLAQQQFNVTIIPATMDQLAKSGIISVEMAVDTLRNFSEEEFDEVTTEVSNRINDLGDSGYVARSLLPELTYI